MFQNMFLKYKVVLFSIFFVLIFYNTAFAEEYNVGENRVFITDDYRYYEELMNNYGSSLLSDDDGFIEGNFYVCWLQGDKQMLAIGKKITVDKTSGLSISDVKRYAWNGSKWSHYDNSAMGISGKNIYTNAPITDKFGLKNDASLDFITKYGLPSGYENIDWWQQIFEGLSKEDIQNFNFDFNEAHFYTPSDYSTVNLHYKDNYFWKFDARIYIQFYGDMFISDKKIMEMLISQMQLSSPFELYSPVGTYVERPSITNDFKAKAYIDFKIGFPCDFDFGEYVLTASFPGSGTSQNPDVKSASVKIYLTNDGSKQEGVFDSDGNIEGVGSGSSSEDSLSGFPLSPGSDGSIVDWFKYIGDLVIWLITYPFKLLSDVFSVLGTYINGMMSQLEETARAINGLLTFIPRDILNVAYGFISFTLLYSIVRGVIK